MNITVAGAGYVGLANAVMLAQCNQVILMDPDEEKVEKINRRISPIEDKEITEYLLLPNINLRATTNEEEAYKNADIVFVAGPTNNKGGDEGFDTSKIEAIIEIAKSHNPDVTIVIKSTVPIGFTKELSEKHNYKNLFFSPEFLREGKALYDCLYPSRIIVGCPDDSEESEKKGEMISKLLLQGTKGKNIPVLFMGSSEAEAVKLFSNTYLAMRIGFINELDSFSEQQGLDAERIITGMGLDSRIGLCYNNPSFGYGGYCLPKDTKALKKEYETVPNELINAIVESNATRKKFIASRIKGRNPKTVGIYRLIMKKGSDNFREASVVDIMEELIAYGLDVIVFEPILDEKEAEGIKLINDFAEFAKKSDVIVANRISSELEPYMDKVYTRDIFGEN